MTLRNLQPLVNVYLQSNSHFTGHSHQLSRESSTSYLKTGASYPETDHNPQLVNPSFRTTPTIAQLAVFGFHTIL